MRVRREEEEKRQSRREKEPAVANFASGGFEGEHLGFGIFLWYPESRFWESISTKHVDQNKNVHEAWSISTITGKR